MFGIYFSIYLKNPQKYSLLQLHLNDCRNWKRQNFAMSQLGIKRLATLLLHAHCEFVECWYRLLKYHMTLGLPSQHYHIFNIALGIVVNSINHRNVLNNTLFYIDAFFVRGMISSKNLLRLCAVFGFAKFQTFYRLIILKAYHQSHLFRRNH